MCLCGERQQCAACIIMMGLGQGRRRCLNLLQLLNWVKFLFLLLNLGKEIMLTSLIVDAIKE